MSGRAELAVIAAVARNGVIGRDNSLPWRLADDMKRLRALTMGHALIMGRKTWDSLGRPLPGRDNVVVSRQSGLLAPGATVVGSFEAALAHCAQHEKAFVFGGAQLYALAIDRADVLYLTEVAVSVEGDTFFPPIDHTRFTEVAREHFEADARNEHAFDFVEYRRTAHAG